MRYEVEQALRDKADKWELDNLKQENSRLLESNRQLTEDVGRLNGRLDNNLQTCQRFIDVLIESGKFKDDEENTFYEIKNSLY